MVASEYDSAFADYADDSDISVVAAETGAAVVPTADMNHLAAVVEMLAAAVPAAVATADVADSAPAAVAGMIAATVPATDASVAVATVPAAVAGMTAATEPAGMCHPHTQLSFLDTMPC